jgi:hypothetical protein
VPPRQQAAAGGHNAADEQQMKKLRLDVCECVLPTFVVENG